MFSEECLLQHGGNLFHAGQPLHNNLSCAIKETRSYGLQVVLGDFNARIHRRGMGEDDILGEYCFVAQFHEPDSRANQQLFMQLCTDTCPW